jgi:tetratricopeptide (TPR) repeat protein
MTGETFRYRAFISYSHRDEAVTSWLHRALETYPLPEKLVGAPTPFGPAPRRVTPIFRDRDELPASGDLGAELTAALGDSLFLIVVCSPAAVRSRWVGEEILAFKRMHGEGRVLALIIEGEPNAASRPGEEDQECFPASLRFRLGADGELSNTPIEVIAADLRPYRDGRRLAKLKLVAGLTGLPLDALAQRETQRRVRRLALLTTASMAGMVFAGALALYANARRIEADQQRAIAERESATARATTDYMIGTFELTNPATENPRTISALTLLTRGAERARTELASQPAVQSRLLAALGRAYNNLGLLHESEVALSGALPTIRRAGPSGAQALLILAATYLREGRLDAATATVRQAEQALGPDPAAHVDIRAMASATRGRILIANGDPKGGLAALDAALGLYRRSPDTPPEELAQALIFRGLSLSDDGQFATAEISLREALEIDRRALGERHLRTGQAWYSLALNELAAGQLAQAEVSIARSLAIERVVLDTDNPTLAESLSMQGQIFQGEHKLDAAAAALSEAIAIWRKAYGRPHFQIGIALVYLALVESDRGRVASALADIADAKHNYDVGYGKLHPNHGDLLVNRALILAKAGRRREAVADCAAGLKILDQTLGADASFTKSDGEVCAKL